MQIDPLDRKGEISRKLELSKPLYPGLWKRITREWSTCSSGSFTWLTYAANYLFSCRGFKWAIDPFSMSSRVSGIEKPDYAHDLSGLSLIVLTHEHNDHLDLNLLSALKNSEIQWIIPENVLVKLEGVVKIPQERIILPLAGKQIQIGPVSLLPFDSLHIHDRYGVPETGYLLQFEDKNWLFPGDIRNYDPKKLPEFGVVDGIFAHLWMGKKGALEPVPPLLNAFCEFYSSFKSNRIVITHLNEFGRDERDLWDEQHFEMARNELSFRKPALHIEKALMGDRVSLDGSYY